MRITAGILQDARFQAGFMHAPKKLSKILIENQLVVKVR
jgi:hypothetical protein